MRIERHSCPRCDGEVFLLRTDGRVLCAGCRLELQSLRVVDPRLAGLPAEVRADAASSAAKPWTRE
jgi:uncharacterized Zn finger protein (UPF0148 family)